MKYGVPISHPDYQKIKYRNSERSSRTFTSYTEMIRRCTKENHKDYPNYGGRGVTVCSRWYLPNGRYGITSDGYQNFKADMGERPEGMTLDRIDPFGNYEPANCRWATISEQNKNLRIPRKGKNLHGMQDTPTYKAWWYLRYERKKPVVERWTGFWGFVNFYEDMGDRPEGTYLRRHDLEIPYGPDNAFWSKKATNPS